MINSIHIYSLFAMEDFVSGASDIPSKKFDLISIWDIHSFVDGELFSIKKSKILEEIGCLNYLSINFHDINKNKVESVKDGKLILFNENHSKQIMNFIDNINKIEEKIPLLIHCHAGISRSATIGLFLTDYLNLDVDDYLERNRTMLVNDLIMEILEKTINHSCEKSIEKWKIVKGKWDKRYVLSQ